MGLSEARPATSGLQLGNRASGHGLHGLHGLQREWVFRGKCGMYRAVGAVGER